jgi:hypothetical protein
MRFLNVKFRRTLKHWRYGGILCFVRQEPMLIKDTKAHCLFCCWRYSSAETEAE